MKSSFLNLFLLVYTMRFRTGALPTKKTSHFRNISDEVELYQRRENVALSFGGGIDSSAVREMFPEAFVST